MRNIKFNKRKASALLMIVTLSSLLILTVAAVSINSVSDFGLTSKNITRAKLELACNSGLNRALAKIEESYNNDSLVVLEPEVTFQGSSTDDTQLEPAEKAYDDEDFYSGGGSEPDHYEFVINQDDDEIIVKYSIEEDEDWNRSQKYTTYNMLINVIAYSENLGFIAIKKNVTAARTSLSMFGVFFQNDLEINPGPDFSLSGLIHTNENMHLTAGNNLYIKSDSVTSAGEMFRSRLDTTSSGGTVKITKEDEDGSYVTMDSGSSKDDSTNDEWVDIASEKWNGVVRDSNLGATEMQAPTLESFEPGGYYYNNASLRIEVVTASNGTKKYQITKDGVTNTYKQDSSFLDGALSESEIYDRRETDSKNVSITEVDTEKLAEIGLYPSDGLIYMTRDDAEADDDGDDYNADSNRTVTGFKLTNGDQLPNAATFVTDLPIYIEGDFNLHTDTNTTTDTWEPCAVIADAITLLSNSWDDSDTSKKPTASDTTFNTIFITGNTKTKSGQYNGGLENFPRFLENWSGKDCDINGAFIQLFRSKYATGNWNGTYYSPPARNWARDERFDSLNNLPPGYADMFPSINFGLVGSNWKQLSKSETSLIENYE